MFKDLLWFLGVVAVLFDVVFIDSSSGFAVAVAVVVAVVVNFVCWFHSTCYCYWYCSVCASFVDFVPAVAEMVVFVHDAVLR